MQNFTSELFRMYRVFPHPGYAQDPTYDPKLDRPFDTLTIALSIENQAYSTWTRGGQPSIAPLFTRTNSKRWNLEYSMNIGTDGQYLSPSEFKEKLKAIGYKSVRSPEQRLTSLKKSLPGFSNKLSKKEQQPKLKPREHKVLNPDDWTTLRMKEKIKKLLEGR